MCIRDSFHGELLRFCNCEVLKGVLLPLQKIRSNSSKLLKVWLIFILVNQILRCWSSQLRSSHDFIGCQVKKLETPEKAARIATIKIKWLYVLQQTIDFSLKIGWLAVGQWRSKKVMQQSIKNVNMGVYGSNTIASTLLSIKSRKLFRMKKCHFG